jgi:hypothetical protein
MGNGRKFLDYFAATGFCKDLWSVKLLKRRSQSKHPR